MFRSSTLGGILVIMSTDECIFLRANSDSCDDDDAVSSEELVRYVLLYLNLQFGLELSIPILGSSASTYWGLPWRPEASDPFPACDEDLADGCLPGSTRFKSMLICSMRCCCHL
jgi:hypothetical protein